MESGLGPAYTVDKMGERPKVEMPVKSPVNGPGEKGGRIGPCRGSRDSRRNHSGWALVRKRAEVAMGTAGPSVRKCRGTEGQGGTYRVWLE